MKININKSCGKNTVSRADGKKIYSLIVGAWHKEKQIVIDFGDISVSSISFLDEALGVLLLKYSPKDILSKIKLVNIRPFDKSVLNNIMSSRMRDNKK